MEAQVGLQCLSKSNRYATRDIPNASRHTETGVVIECPGLLEENQ